MLRAPQALAELASSDEENEASPASPGKGGATESIDFGAIAGQTGEPDWFEKEREAERQSAALQRIADPRVYIFPRPARTGSAPPHLPVSLSFPLCSACGTPFTWLHTEVQQ